MNDWEADTVELPSPARPEEGRAGTLSSRVEVDLGALSHPGKVRRSNEDHFLVSRVERSLEILLTNLPRGQVPDRCAEIGYGMLVADGMGGHAAGEIASRKAISILVDLVLQTPDWIMRLDEQRAPEVLRRMEQRYQQVQEILAEQAQADPSLAGMGTTMTLAASLGADMVIVHVGDSRAYLFREGQLHQLTRDHTVVQSLVDVQEIRPEDVAAHPMRHVLTKAIDTKGETVQADLHQLRLSDGDQVLLCTDGLTEMVPEASIADVLHVSRPSADTCRALVDLALEGGGRDNVTVVLARYRIPATC